MPTNNSILRATGLTDPNFNFHITDDGEFNYLTQNDKHDYATLNYAATLDVMPECCPYCAHSSLYRHSTEYSVHVLPSTNGYHQVLHLDKKRYKCNGLRRTVVAHPMIYGTILKLHALYCFKYSTSHDLISQPS
ncbi:hypothetical protein EQG49_06895 [Periweissella cryptocerci]|uniref:Transposase IS204/IS1001/IS1096/IS1165 zinc-finger domain-containing protein n=1 Tax=Periweissella cryptocerci TaxID=2506420 RepID=A0A4P6YU29_9LACO|nr:hypothetical protein EQG49_06895 [Periweissella cryptocerci]